MFRALAPRQGDSCSDGFIQKHIERLLKVCYQHLILAIDLVEKRKRKKNQEQHKRSTKLAAGLRFFENIPGVNLGKFALVVYEIKLWQNNRHEFSVAAVANIVQYNAVVFE
jgi:hypothetical protein